MMIVIYILVGAVLILAAYFSSIPWFTHLEMVNDSTKKSGWGSYRTFKKWFNNYQWQRNSSFSESLFNRELDCQYHANIIQFEGVGMKINNPISYMFVVLYVKRYCRSLEGNNRFDFKNALLEKKKSKKEGYLVELPDGSKTFVTMAEIYSRTAD